MKIKFHSSLHWVVMNVVISSLYNFYVFISMLINKINIYLFFCLSKIIFSFYDAVRDFSFWNLCIQFPFRVPCYNCLFSFCSLYDPSIVVLSLFLFILMRSIYSYTFHLYSYIQAEQDGGAIPVRNTNLNQRIFHDNQSTEQFHRVFHDNQSTEQFDRINSAEEEQEQKFLYMKLR